MWSEDFDGPAGAAPAGWQISAAGWGNANYSGWGAINVPVGTNIFRSAPVNYPSGTRLALQAGVMMPSTSGNLAGVFMRHHGSTNWGEIDVVESWGPNDLAGKKAQVATHQCEKSAPNVPYPCQPDVTSANNDWEDFKIPGFFALGNKPWDSYHRYQAEWTVASTNNLIMSAYDYSYAQRYQTTKPSNKLLRVQANTDHFVTISNKYAVCSSCGGTRSEMWVDYIQLLAYY
ncbi:hypothetical protein [Nocardioides bigeumensis]|uniref:GH16 domain-containing protein n=1 Tax=Nocardioides bigeumensis TaxID=433657 RepID=A0ABP5JVM0_9ACTN